MHNKITPPGRYAPGDFFVEAEGKALPRWKTVISLDEKASQKYQDFASKVAKKKGVTGAEMLKLLTSRCT